MADGTLDTYVIELGDKLWNRCHRLFGWDNLSMAFRVCERGNGQVDVANPSDEDRRWLREGNTITVSRGGRVVQAGVLTVIGESLDAGGRIVSKPSWADTLGAFLGSELLYPNPGGRRTDGQGDNPFDLRNGYATTVVLGYVNANVGPGAWPARRAPGLVVAADPGEGAWLENPAAARYDAALDFLRNVAIPNGIVFGINTADRTHTFWARGARYLAQNVQFSWRLNNLGAGQWSITAPKMTRVMVLGPFDGTEQVVFELTGAEAEAQEAKWGRIARGVYSSQTMVDVKRYSDFAKAMADELRLAEQSLSNAQRTQESASKALDDKLAASPQVPADIAAAQAASVAAAALLVEAQATMDNATARRDAADIESRAQNMAATIAALDAAARRMLADQGETVAAEYEILEGTFNLGVDFDLGDIVSILPPGWDTPIEKPVREVTETFSTGSGRKVRIVAGDYSATGGTAGAFTTRELISTIHKLKTRS